MITIGGTKPPFLRYIFSIFTYAKDMTDIWKSSPESFLSLTSYWTRPSRNTANTYLKANARNPVCDLSLCPTKVLSAFCSKYKDLSYICTLIKFKSMLTKVIEQAKIDHFTKWFERADKIVIVSHVSPDGDAIGSSLGLYHFLDSLIIQITGKFILSSASCFPKESIRMIFTVRCTIPIRRAVCV